MRNPPEQHRCLASVLPPLDAADGKAQLGGARQVRLADVELQPLVPPQVVVGRVSDLLRLQHLADGLGAVEQSDSDEDRFCNRQNRC